MIKDKKIIVFMLIGMLIGVLCCINYGISHKLFDYLILTGALCAFALQDINEKRISNKGLLIMLVVCIASVFFTMKVEIYIKSVLCGALTFVFMLIMYFVSMRTLGFGDVKLFAIIGFLIGIIETIQLMFMTLLLTSVFGILLLLLKRRNLKTEVPMVPYMLAALMVNNILVLIN